MSKTATASEEDLPEGYIQVTEEENYELDDPLQERDLTQEEIELGELLAARKKANESRTGIPYGSLSSRGNSTIRLKQLKNASGRKTRRSLRSLFTGPDPIPLSQLASIYYENIPTLVDTGIPTTFKLSNDADRDDEINNITFDGIGKNSIKDIISVSKQLQKKVYEGKEKADFSYRGKKAEIRESLKRGDPKLIYSYTIVFTLKKDQTGTYTGTWYKGQTHRAYLYTFSKDDPSQEPNIIEIIDKNGTSDGPAMVLNRKDDKRSVSYIYFSRDVNKGQLCNVMEEPFKLSREDKGIKCVEFFNTLPKNNINDLDTSLVSITGGGSGRRHKKTTKRIRKTMKRIRKTIKKRIRKTTKRIKKTMKRK